MECVLLLVVVHYVAGLSAQEAESMVSDNEYQQRIGQYDWADVLDLWVSVKGGDTPGWEAGKAFEYLVLRAFQLEGAEIR